MNKQQTTDLRDDVFNNVLDAYRAARQVNASTNHPFSTTLRAYLITHFGSRGRLAVEAANREVTAQKQQAMQAALPKERRFPKVGGKRPARPLDRNRRDQPQVQPPQVQNPQPVGVAVVAAGNITAQQASGVGGAAKKLMQAAVAPTALSTDELSAILEMKPKAAGIEYGADRLRVTLSERGIEFAETMTQTQLAALLMKSLTAPAPAQ